MDLYLQMATFLKAYSSFSMISLFSFSSLKNAFSHYVVGAVNTTKSLRERRCEHAVRQRSLTQEVRRTMRIGNFVICTHCHKALSKPTGFLELSCMHLTFIKGNVPL